MTIKHQDVLTSLRKLSKGALAGNVLSIKHLGDQILDLFAEDDIILII